MPRILVLNANTTASVTDLVVHHVRDVLGADVELIPATARLGTRYISTETSYAIAGHSALDCLALSCAETPSGFDSVLLACFGDPGLFAWRKPQWKKPHASASSPLSQVECCTALTCSTARRSYEQVFQVRV